MKCWQTFINRLGIGRVKTRSCAPKSLRNEKGLQLVELMVALSVSGILGMAVANSLSTMSQVGTACQNQVIASSVAQQVIDNARNMPFATLEANVGQTYTLLVNKTTSGQAGPTAIPRPLLLDMDTFNYTNSGKANLFKGTVTAGFTNLNDNVKVTVVVTWKAENSGSSGNKTYTTSTIISPTGIHN